MLLPAILAQRSKWLMWFTPILKLANPGSNPTQDGYIHRSELKLFPAKLCLLNFIGVKLNSFPCFQAYISFSNAMMSPDD